MEPRLFEKIRAEVETSKRLVAQARRLSIELDATVAAAKETLDKGARQARASADPLQRFEAANLAKVSRQPASTPKLFLPPTVLLLVEDSDDDFLLLERSLHKVEVPSRILRAKTGTEALQLLSDLKMELLFVVLDLHLPDMDGFVLCDEIKSRSSPVNQVRFAFWSGHFDRKTLARADACGVDAVFSKQLNSLITAQSLKELVFR